jgi:hypothetical protein
VHGRSVVEARIPTATVCRIPGQVARFTLLAMCDGPGYYHRVSIWSRNFLVTPLLSAVPHDFALALIDRNVTRTRTSPTAGTDWNYAGSYEGGACSASYRRSRGIRADGPCHHFVGDLTHATPEPAGPTTILRRGINSKPVTGRSMHLRMFLCSICGDGPERYRTD